MSEFLNTSNLPFCKGCGHHLVTRNTVKALDALGYSPLDVVLVTDIGCHGIVDNAFNSHTVHGLHGRSVALGTGVAMGLPVGKKVVVFLGDGGATIGLQHILEAARLNIPLTAVVHNNMVYGMTGGQPSGLTPCGFRTTITPEGNTLDHHDLCKLVIDAGAAYAARVIGVGDYSETLKKALETDGFALVEALELCPSYGVKLNPDLRLRELAETAGFPIGEWRNPQRVAFRVPHKEGLPSLLDSIDEVPVHFASPLQGRLALVLSGSAGEGVQQAAELLAKAAIAAGLHATKKGSYPVTVGVGFSTAEVILSRDPIEYHGASSPDIFVITSEDGLRNNTGRIQGQGQGTIWIDASLQAPETKAEVRVYDFRGKAGARNAAIYAVLTLVRETNIIPAEALIQVIRGSAVGRHLPPELLEG